MNIYTGIDIVQNKRIENSILKTGKRFLDRVFTENEIKYCSQKKTPYPCFAARFAAKEAFIKAFYQAFKKKLFLKNIEVYGKTGEPAEIFLHIDKSNIKPFKSTLSISHEEDYSVAIVIIYTE